MLITYRQTGDLFALLTLATVALAATVLTIAATGFLATCLDWTTPDDGLGDPA
jgi:hypothetical protein